MSMQWGNQPQKTYPGGIQPVRPEWTRAVIEPDAAPASVPWCLACGFQHELGTHCADCTGDHDGGFCMTVEARRELAALDLATPPATAPLDLDAVITAGMRRLAHAIVCGEPSGGAVTRYTGELVDELRARGVAG